MEKTESEVVVIGGGIIGSSIAVWIWDEYCVFTYSRASSNVLT